MVNAKTEFLKETKSRGSLPLCAKVFYNGLCSVLQINYSSNELDEFLKSLNFDYSNGYGSQKVYGTIWYKDGTWSERGSYDGSEWWVHKTCPPIPEECQRES